MSIQQATVPIILCFSGHDPSGGAGLQADIEAIAAQGAHAATVVTALTVQDTRNVVAMQPVPITQLRQAATSILADMPVAAFKIGLLGSAEIANTIAELLATHPALPVVLDPILAAGGGTGLADTSLLNALRQQLLPKTTLLTPNSLEARQLSGKDKLEDAAMELLALGCQHVLITGTHEAGNEIIHHLYGQTEKTFVCARLPGEFHGSGCTLAASLAARLASGEDMLSATTAALDYTYACLQQARPLGKGQLIPSRWPA